MDLHRAAREGDLGRVRGLLDQGAEVDAAVVDEDRAALEAMDAYRGGGDPYTWTRDYGRWGDVHLVMPPGDPRTWNIHVTRGDRWVGVDVEMWTREEGRSDLTLELELRARPDGGGVRARFVNLHVL